MEHRRAYKRIVAIVEHNTANEAQGPLLSERGLRTVAGHAGLDRDAVDNAISAAVDNDDLVTVRQDGQLYLGIPDEEAMQAAILSEVELDEPNKDAIGRINSALDTIREAA